MVHLLIGASDGHELFTALLRLDASFAMTPCDTPKYILNSILGFEAQTKQNRPAMILRPKPPNLAREPYPLRLL
jgi:hypothetical protein